MLADDFPGIIPASFEVLTWANSMGIDGSHPVHFTRTSFLFLFFPLVAGTAKDVGQSQRISLKTPTHGILCLLIV